MIEMNAMARARRMVPALAPLVDVLAVAERNGDDPEQVAHDLWTAGRSTLDVRRALNALVTHRVIPRGTEWVADVRSAMVWAHKHNRSPLSVD